METGADGPFRDLIAVTMMPNGALPAAGTAWERRPEEDDFAPLAASRNLDDPEIIS